MATPRLNLTRDQFASFLQDFEQIKQFENLFAVVSSVINVPDDIIGLTVVSGSAQATANQALAEINDLEKEIKNLEAFAFSSGSALASANQALAEINDLDESMDLLATAPQQNNITLSHDVTGILPFANQTARVRSNQVLTWLSM